jgi:hypothetical protein
LANQPGGEQHIITNVLWMTVMEASANTTMQVDPYGIRFHIEMKVATFLTQKRLYCPCSSRQCLTIMTPGIQRIIVQ